MTCIYLGALLFSERVVRTKPDYITGDYDRIYQSLSTAENKRLLSLWNYRLQIPYTRSLTFRREIIVHQTVHDGQRRQLEN